MTAGETVRETGRGIIGWILVVLLILPWAVIQLAAWLTRRWAYRRGGLE
jgi:hypothetical protein